MTTIDMQAGLSDEVETVVLDAPTIPFWSENLLFTPYDPKSDLCMWLHLGTIPTDWEFWEDRVLIGLPGQQGVLTMWACNRTVSELKPGGANLFFKCREPFKRWKVTFDGFADHVSHDNMIKGGIAPVTGPRRRVVVELEVECVGPVWDAAKGGGDVKSQGWATDHYEQMFRARGTVRVEQDEWPFDGLGWRDHSRGPRGGGGGKPWGGHMIVGALWPSGRSVIFSRYWTPDGEITLDGGVLADASGSPSPVEILETPRLRGLIPNGERFSTRLRHGNGEAQLDFRCDRAIWTSLQNRLPVGTDMTGLGSVYILNWGECEWDGETGNFYIERSDPLSKPPIVLQTK